MDVNTNKGGPEYNNDYCPYCNSLKINQIINLSNIIYDQNFVLLINSISSNIKIFYQKLRKIINDIKNISSSLENQINHSKYLLKGLTLKDDNFIERYFQLCDRVDMINESKKLFNENISLINNNLNIFITDVKQIFKKMKIIRNQKINQAFNDTKKINSVKKNIKFSHENINLNSRNNNLNNNINSKNEDILIRKVFSSKQSPKNKLNISDDDNMCNNNIEYLVNKINPYDLKRKNNNTLIFPNNINQNIFNCTITSRDLRNLNKNANIDCLNKTYRKSPIYNRNSKLIKNKKLNRCSSIPDIICKNSNFSTLSQTNKKIYINKSKNNSSLSKQNNNNINNISYNKNYILNICYKVKELLNIIYKSDIDKNIILDEKRKKLNFLIDNISKNNKIKRNFNKLHRNSSADGIDNKNNKNLELLNIIKFLNKKIEELENKIKEKDKYISEIIKKNKDNNPINQDEKKIVENNNKLKELNKNIFILKKENKELKNKIVQLENLNQEINKLKEIIIDKNIEVEQLKSKIKNNEIKKESLLVEKIEIKLNNDNNIKNFKEGLIPKNVINNSIENLKEEITKKEQKINELNNLIKLYEKQIKEQNILKDENIQLNKKIEELKNILNNNNNLIQNLNEELENYKKQIKQKEKIEEELKKKNQQEKEFNEKIKNISDKNKELLEQIDKISSEKQELEVSNNDKKEKIIKMQNTIDELNIKINSINNSKINNNNIDNIKNKNIINSQQLDLSNNSLSNEIVNYNSKEIKNINSDEKIKKLIDENNSLKEKLNDVQIEMSICKNEFNYSKLENNELKSRLSLENDKKEKNYTPDKYNILCDKNYYNLQWFLLIPKDKEFNNNYEDLIWIEKTKIDNIDKFNKFESEIEIQNKRIIDNVTKLEQKEEIISKLKFKLNNYEKKISETNSVGEFGVSIDKFNLVLNQLNDLEEKFRILQDENKKLRLSLSDVNKNKNKIESITEGSNNLGYDKNYVIQIKEEENDNKNNIIKNNNIINNNENVDENESENFSETDTEISELKNELENTKIQLKQLLNEYNNLENKFKLLKDSCSNLLIKMNIPKKFKDEIREMLKLFEFTDSEILFIVDKKKQFY